jgi:hypothetical protein
MYYYMIDATNVLLSIRDSLNVTVWLSQLPVPYWLLACELAETFGMSILVSFLLLASYLVLCFVRSLRGSYVRFRNRFRK